MKLVSDKILHSLDPPPIPTRITREGEKKGLVDPREGGVEAGARDSLMDPGLGTGGEPRKESLIHSYTSPRP